MGRKKAQRFQENLEKVNIIQDTSPLFNEIKGNWHTTYFKNENPIVLELGCGKGEYTIGLAKLYPEKNFIGIDIKGDRIAVGSDLALEANLLNVAFLRTKVHQLLDFFQENEISEIWITFPDPQPIKSGIRRRMTNERFLAIYDYILNNEGILHLKTDHEAFFDYSLETLENYGVRNLQSTKDLYSSELNVRHYGIKTRFEQIFTDKGFLINYLCCQLEKKPVEG